MLMPVPEPILRVASPLVAPPVKPLPAMTAVISPDPLPPVTADQELPSYTMT